MPTLYVVATPIGNLNDMTPRAIETLRSAALIAAEDTRVTMKLLNRFAISTPLTACHQHNEEGKGVWLAEKMLAEGIDVAVTTDAGTPCVSDPGYGLVKACVERGIEVIPVPGCCASVSALSVSGFDTREFAFYGFLPREKKELREKLLSMARGVPVAAVHESPYRVIELVETIAEVLPQTRISCSCDLTKLHEKTIRGRADEVLEMLRANPKAEKGEYCLILNFHEVTLPEETAPVTEASLEAQLVEQMLEGLDLRDAQSELVLRGAKKNAVKQAALRLKKLFAQDDAESQEENGCVN
ncbi:MAG: 16S rRNA (cytidine(1402)-2'-O)-methyltransferase [Aristaeellaceae bacterium]